MEYRNRYIKEKLLDAFRITDGLELDISIGVAICMAPDIVIFKKEPPPEHIHTAKIDLGNIARKEKTSFKEDCILIAINDVEIVKIPYRSIMSLTAPAELKDMLGWDVYTKNDRSLAYVQVLLPEHRKFL